MIAKERKNETIKLQRLHGTHSIELIHAMTVMYEGSITCYILLIKTFIIRGSKITFFRQKRQFIVVI